MPPRAPAAGRSTSPSAPPARILVTDTNAAGGYGALTWSTWRSRSLVSDFSNAAQGDVAYLGGLVADATGMLAVSGFPQHRVFYIDLATGQRTRLADFEDSGAWPGLRLLAEYRPSTGAASCRWSAAPTCSAASTW